MSETCKKSILFGIPTLLIFSKTAYQNAILYAILMIVALWKEVKFLCCMNMSEPQGVGWWNVSGSSIEYDLFYLHVQCADFFDTGKVSAELLYFATQSLVYQARNDKQRR
jgi:hypothetical protein